ncbi:Cell division ATP-binding protein FtsE [Oligella ureolytica]|uniref:ATP-binding cassette domain-containing protein n=1 Tax=Oligella ureolytica TaxID=90244 RepID=A0A378XJ72_9BURK|nr:ATP-binding cassette domain-containing protein [Oligella ureolytica]QPT39692.1 ATP-binding cassette domain-containing protein [Oligella ureolytica]SUA52417.1 Cell division ATP-binding protein FtsE [Oligella ureolytica]SUA57209.1 Cell division ATP-binding protein FtsE [Oligella ureolytica]
MNTKTLQLFFQSETASIPLEIRADSGQLVHLWGPSGVGKSTLLARIWGSRSIGKGSLIINFDNGQSLDLGKMSPAQLAFVRPRLMTYVAQNPLVLPRSRMSDWFTDYSIDELHERLFYLDLAPELLQRCATDLSGGELQRFVLLRAVFSETPILLLDEPCTGLDPKRFHQVVRLLKKEKDRQKLVIFSSHTHETWVDQSIQLF